MEDLRGTLARMASARHLPETASREEKALQEADRLASGGDRVDGDTGANAPSARLDSVFHTIRLEGKGSDSRATAFCRWMTAIPRSFPVRKQTARKPMPACMRISVRR